MTAGMMLRHAIILASLTALCACKLLDQTTFAPSPEAPVKKVEAPGPPPQPTDKRTPLLTIGFATPNPDYKDLLTYAVQQAQERRPDVSYDVVSVVPANGDTVAQELAASRGSSDATQVMQSMIGLGVPDTRIHLGARTEPGVSERLVRVYVR
jgi:hypothetical protein